MSVEEIKLVVLKFSHTEKSDQEAGDSELTKRVVADFKAMLSLLEKFQKAGYRLLSDPFREQIQRGMPLEYEMVFEKPTPAKVDKTETAGDVPPLTEEEAKQRQAFMEKFVEELGVSIKTSNCLRNAGILTIGDLTQWTEADLLRVKNFDRKSLNKIKEILHENGLSLKKN